MIDIGIITISILGLNQMPVLVISYTIDLTNSDFEGNFYLTVEINITDTNILFQI